MAPPTSGPMAMARPPTAPQAPSAMPRRSAGTAADRSVRVSGVTMAAPMPWAMRPTSSISTLVDMAENGRGRREDGDADDEHASPPEAVAERRAGEQEDRERQGVGVDGPFELLERGPQLLADDIEGGRHDEVVEHDHEQGHGRHRERRDGHRASLHADSSFSPPDGSDC